MSKPQKIAVRQLIEFVLRSGSIDSRRTSNHTAQEGGRIHRELQKKADETYQKEVHLQKTVWLNSKEYIVDGRADGLFFNDEMQPVIDEIKTSEPAFEELLPEQIDMFWQQLRCYGYLYCIQEELTSIILQLTYYQTTTKKVTQEQKSFSLDELTVFFDSVLADYEKWLIFKEDWRKIRNQSLKALSFPYEEFRKGQRSLLAAVYKTIISNQKLFVEAPTGTGKTISTLFPALKSIGEEESDRLFYLTAKTITRQVVEDAVSAMEMKLKSVTLTAKEKICFLDERICTPEYCPFANGYYDRLNEGLWDLLHNENQLTRAVIEDYARKHQLCPFELSLDVSLWCDLVICDYNYLFDPIIYLRRFFEEEKKEKNTVFLIDEAHNLVHRSREMYSAELGKDIFEKLKHVTEVHNRSLSFTVQKVVDVFENLEESCFKEEEKEFVAQKEPVDTLLQQLYTLTDKMKEWVIDFSEEEPQTFVLQCYFDCLRYLKISEYYDDSFYTYLSKEKNTVKIKLFCVNPAFVLNQRLDKGKSSILFSATFTPLNYYREILGGDETSLTYRVPTPFPQENQLLFVETQLQTTYRKREESLQAICDYLLTMTQQKMGNYLIFFPSYLYMQQVYELFSQLNPDILTNIQKNSMDEGEREAFLQQFKEQPKETFIGFCVLGGIFSEGIDLKSSRLIGTIVVGVGLPQINHEQELIKNYFDEKNGFGFSYAYQIPGLNKVLQAGGRVIRDTEDKGVILLLDQRFSTTNYQQMFPPHWKSNIKITHPNQMIRELSQFWLEK